MKTTIDLPVELVRQVKIRAVQEGRKMKEVVAELLQESLRSRALRRRNKPGKPNLPLIECSRQPGPGEELTPERVARHLAEQEGGWGTDARRR